MGKWHKGKEVPKKSGWYERDYRGKMERDVAPGIYLDRFDVVDDKKDICYPGVWYVNEPPGSLNDARWDNLRWRKKKKGDK